MKLQFLHSVSAGSGANNHINEFIAAARSQGADVRCVGQAVQSLQIKGKSVRTPVPQILKDLVYLSSNRGYRQRALTQVRSWAPEAIYFRGAPYMAYGREIAERLGLPLFYELNAPYPDEHILYHGGRLEAVARRIERRNREAARRIFVVSRQLAEILIEDGVPPAKIIVVPNAVRLERFDPSPRPADGQIRFGFVGSLQVWHGIEVLLEAFATVLDEVPDARLDIVGAGPLAEWLAGRLQGSPHRERLTWRGALPSAAIPAFLSEMDVLLAPYPALSRFYFSPLKLFEYMGSGRAIVASDLGQIADILHDNDNGRLVSPGDARALAACCIELAQQPERRLALGRAARETATRHTWQENANTILHHIGEGLREETS